MFVDLQWTTRKNMCITVFDLLFGKKREDRIVKNLFQENDFI